MGSKSNFRDIAGQSFGRLTVLFPTNQRKQRSVLWKCLCACGKEILTTSSSLRRGQESCGCLRVERVAQSARQRVYNLTGFRFSRLLVLNRSSKRDGLCIMWDCLCDCGNAVTVRGSHLTAGDTRSCGCLHKEISAKVNTHHGLSKNKEFKLVLTRRRKAKKLLVDSAWTTEMEIALNEVFKSCVICGRTYDLSVDHILPLDLGYGLSIDNAVVLCISCNSSKSNKYITDLSPEIRRKLIDASCIFQDYWEGVCS